MLRDAPAAAVPADLAGFLTELSSAVSCWSPSLGPGGTELAFVSDFDGPARAYITPVGQWKPRRVSDVDELINGVSWSPSGDWLMLSGQPGNTSRTTLTAVRPDGSEHRLVGGGAQETVFAGCWTPRGGQYAFTRAAPDLAGTQAVLVDVETLDRRPVAEGPGLLVLDVARDERHVLLRRGPRGRRHLALAELGRDAVRRLVPGGTTGTSEIARFSPDGTRVLVRTDHDRDYAVLGHVELAEWDSCHFGQYPSIRVLAERPDAEVDTFLVGPDGQTLLVAWNVLGANEMELVDLRSGERTPVGPGLPWGVVEDWGLTRLDGRLHLLAGVSTPSLPRAVWRQELPAGPAVKLTDAAEPSPPRDGWPTPTHHRFPAHDGLALTGWLYRPPGADGPVPTVVSLHGGPEGQERPTFARVVQACVAAGIAVFLPDVRGSSGHGRDFLERDAGLRRRDAIRDVATSAQYLVGAGLAPERGLGVHGVSYGGYLVLAAVADYPDVFSAAVCVCGIADFATFFETTEPWIAATATTKYGDPNVDAVLLHDLSPLHRLHQAKTPTRLVHGELDSNVPISEARQALVELRIAGVPSDLVPLPGEGHQVLQQANRLRELEAVTGWFREWL